MEIAGWILYVLFVILATFKGELIIGNKLVENKLIRFVVSLVIFPLMGLIFWCMGWIGKIILAPFAGIF